MSKRMFDNTPLTGIRSSSWAPEDDLSSRNRADDRANIKQASTGGPDFTVKEWPDPASVAAGEALSAEEERLVRDNFARLGRGIYTGEFRRLLATLDAARSRPVGGLDVEALAKAIDNVWARGGIDDDHEEAVQIAAEYARLAPPSSSPEPEAPGLREAAERLLERLDEDDDPKWWWRSEAEDLRAALQGSQAPGADDA